MSLLSHLAILSADSLCLQGQAVSDKSLIKQNFSQSVLQAMLLSVSTQVNVVVDNVYTYGSFRKLGVPSLGVLIIRIL